MTTNFSAGPPQDASPGDVAHTTVKALLSAIPGLGGPAAEYYAALFAAPIARRQIAWLTALGDEFERLRQQVAGCSVERLTENEPFVSTLLQATQAAMRTHQEVKRDALRNVVLNTALKRAPDDDLQLIFINLIDQFTATHLRLLAFLHDPAGWAQRAGVTLNPNEGNNIAARIEEAMPELRGKRDIYLQVAADLDARGLTRAMHAMTGVASPRSSLEPRTEPLGRQLLAFVSSPASI